MLNAQKIILYICPGHQLSEFVPWLINHSPEMDHGCTFADDWTHYESSYGIGKEPIESHWCLPSNYTRTYKDHVRGSAEFPADHFATLFNLWGDKTGTKCVFLNLMFENYKHWVQGCRAWFTKYHPDINLIVVGHTMYLQHMINPSRFFIKEGYILDDELELKRDTWTLDNWNDPLEVFQGRVTLRKNYARGQELTNLYTEAGFDAVWGIEDIQEPDSCKKLISTLVEPPTNFDELYQTYMDLNPPDIELDNIIKSYLYTLD
tara:strand:- start:2471 stop:3256 length:786 start_codon:yes stop_codon:yes gene_type:complete